MELSSPATVSVMQVFFCNGAAHQEGLKQTQICKDSGWRPLGSRPPDCFSLPSAGTQKQHTYLHKLQLPHTLEVKHTALKKRNNVLIRSAKVIAEICVIYLRNNRKYPDVHHR